MRLASRAASTIRSAIILACSLAYAGTVTGEAYVIIDAISLPESSKQPTWLAVKRGNRLVHLPTKQSIVKVNPGKYRLYHFDFNKPRSNGAGTIFSTDFGGYEFEALPDSIVYVGLFVLEDDQSNPKESKVRVANSQLLLEWACDTNPEIFKRMPVKFLGAENDGKEVRINCDT
jgi:hypothetical protein